MNVSVIIPTYNGAHKLPAIIQALEKQDIQPLEIIVVIDGSIDNTSIVLNELQRNMPLLKIIEQENRGRAAVRNRGAAEAKGELLVFFDDDMLPLSNCIQQHVLHHQEFPSSVLTGAQIDLDGRDRSDIQQYKARLSVKWSEPLKNKSHKPLKKDEIFLTAANFSILKKLFFNLGGFDERLTDAEDFDLGVRAFKEGVNLFYNYQAFAWHNDEITSISYVRRLRQYRNAHDKLKELKPELYQDVQQISSTIPHSFKKKLFLFFASKYWLDWVNKSSWKVIIPKKLKYKLYDLIITANGVYFPEKVPL